MYTIDYYSAYKKKKKANPTICCNIDELGRRCAMWNKLDTERQIQHDLS